MSLEKEDVGNDDKTRIKIEEFIYKNRIPLSLLLAGLILIGFGVMAYKKNIFAPNSNIEILDNSQQNDQNISEIIVEISGAVENSGVYRLSEGSRIEDALISAGGVSADADRVWMDKFLNKAAKLSDGQKVYIPKNSESFDSTQDKQSDVLSAKNDGVYQSTSPSYSSSSEEKVNINTADEKSLENLWGIGPVTAQNIIEQRPYSKVEELLEKKILKKNVYDKNKDLMTVY